MLLFLIFIMSFISCNRSFTDVGDYSDLDNEKLQQIILVDHNTISSILESSKSYKDNIWSCHGGGKCNMQVFEAEKKDKICRSFKLFIEKDLLRERVSLRACRVSKNNWIIV